jgi:hypothetical protein
VTVDTVTEYLESQVPALNLLLAGGGGGAGQRRLDPMMIGLAELVLVPDELPDPQAASASDDASTSGNTCDRRGRRVALMSVSVPGDCGQGT